MKIRRTTQSHVIYETFCGCTHTRDDLVQVNSKLLCPVHREPVESKYGYCAKCGNEVRYFRLQTLVPDICADCNPNLRKSQNFRARNRRQKQRQGTLPEEQFVEVMMASAACVYRPLCFTVHFRQKALPCVGCDEFRAKDPLEDPGLGVDLELLDYHVRNDLDAQGKETWGPVFEKRKRDLLSPA